MIYVKSDKAGRVLGHFTLYNLIAYSVVLSKSGGSPDRQIALASNPITCHWSDRIAQEINVPFEWLDNPDYDYEDMQRSRDRLGRIMEFYFESTKDMEVRRIIESVLKGHGLKEGEIIPKEMAFSISKEIADRVTHHLFNRPYSKPISPTQMRESFGRPALKRSER
jgi:hypothetical protein